MDKEFSKGGEVAKRFPVEGRKHDIGHGDVVIAAITSCTNTSNPSVMVAAGLLAKKAVGEGPEAEAVGEDLARAGLAGRRRVSREVRPAEGARQARLQPRRLRLHQLHRQFRAARRGNLRVDQQERRRRRRGALGQSQFRRPRQRGRARELSRLAAAGRRLCARRQHERRSGASADRHRQEGQEGLSERHLADQPRDRRGDPQDPSPRTCSRRNTPTCSRARRTGARSR